MCEHSDMAKRKALFDWRKQQGLSLEQAAARFGLASKGYLSEIERGARCSVAVALAIEENTGGVIKAASLNPDIALIDKARAA